MEYNREGVTTSVSNWEMIPVSDLVQNQDVIQIEGSLSIEDACQVLIENNISSAPVYATGENSHYVGMFDYGDVIAYILLVLHRDPVQESVSDDMDLDSFEIKDIVRRAVQGQKIPVEMASDLSRKNPFYAILQEATLLSAVEIFACGTHRVNVLGSDGEIKGILSQSTVIKYLFEHRKQFPHIDKTLDRTIQELGLGEESIIGVNSNASVLDALSLMSSNGVSSVAVLDGDNNLVGNISITDVKHVVKSYTKRLLWKSCLQFVNQIRKNQGVIDGQDRIPVFDVRKESTLGYAIAKILATKTHRIWVVNNQQKAIGVISLTDIVRVLASHVGVEARERRGSIAVFRN